MRIQATLPVSYSHVFAFVLLVLLLPGKAFSQEMLSLEEAIRLGLEKNYEIRIASTEDDIAANNVTWGNAGFLPVVNGRATRDFSHTNTRNQFENTPPRIVNNSRTNTTNASVLLNWTVFDGGRMFITYNRLKALEQSGKLLTKAVVENTVADVADAYYDVVRQANKIKAQEEAIAISESRMQIAQAQYDVGVSAKVEILRAQVDYNTDRSELLRQQEILQNAKINLNELLGRDPLLSFVAADSITINRQLTYEPANTSLVASNPNLKRLQLQRDIALYDLRAARAQRLPTLGVSGSYGYNNALQDPVIFGNTAGTNQSRRLGFNYGLVFTVPIFNGFEINRQVQNSKIIVESNALQYQQEQLRLQSDLARAYSRFTNRLELLALEEANQKLADQNAAIALERYKLGLLTALELREAQRNQLVASNRLIDITYEAKAAETALKLLTSTLLQESLEG